MNVNKLLTKDYEKTTLGERGKNKPKTNPKQTQTNPNKAKQIEDPEGTQTIYAQGNPNKSKIPRGPNLCPRYFKANLFPAAKGRATASKFPIFFVDIFHPSLLYVVLF